MKRSKRDSADSPPAALMDSGRQLLRKTEQDIEVVEGRPVHLRK